MQKISHNLYNLAWFGNVLVFLVLFLWKGEFCLMYSCIGDNNVGMAYGISGIIIYSIIIKLFGKRGNFLNARGIKNGFLYIILVLIIFLVYYLGKANGIGN